MELIIKPTSACNMNCDFCAASNIKTKNKKHADQRILNYIDQINPECLIFTGGDPLCVDPEYYLDLIEKYPDKHIDMTTNLKDFYLNPDKWLPVLKHPNVSVCTSFNYGKTRKWSKDQIYTEDMFKKIMYKFKDLIGYMPPFIAVIDEENIDTVFKTINLAKELGTKCRINNAIKMGRQGKYFPRYKVFEKWLEIIEAGLDNYEITCSERKYGKCPINSNLLCSTTIAAVYIDNNDNFICTNCEDKLNLNKIINDDTLNYNNTINKNCTYCELYRICNGCSTNREQAKKYCPEYCSEMLKLKDRIIKTKWKL